MSLYLHPARSGYLLIFFTTYCKAAFRGYSHRFGLGDIVVEEHATARTAEHISISVECFRDSETSATSRPVTGTLLTLSTVPSGFPTRGRGEGSYFRLTCVAESTQKVERAFLIIPVAGVFSG